MRILYIHQYFNTRLGSSGTRSYEFARALIQAGHDVTMVCASTGGSVTGLTGAFGADRRAGIVDGIEVVEFRVGYSNHDPIFVRAAKFLKFAWRCTLEVFSRDFDLVVATSTPLTVVVPGAIARLVRRKPFVFEVRDLWPELPIAMGLKNPFAIYGMRFLEWIGYRTATRLVALAPGIAEGIAKSGVPAERIELIPNGCDFDLFEAAAMRPASRFPDRINPDDLVAIFAGAHGKANGLDAVLDAATELRRLGKASIKILLIGDGSEKARLQERVRNEGLANVVLSPPVPKTELASLLRGSDVALQVLADVPAFYNGTSPNKFFDYLAARRPVLINYPGWLANLVTQARSGFVVAPGDATAFARALVHAAEMRAELPTMGERAAELGKTSFDRGDLSKAFVSCVVRAHRDARGSVRVDTDRALQP